MYHMINDRNRWPGLFWLMVLAVILAIAPVDKADGATTPGMTHSDEFAAASFQSYVNQWCGDGVLWTCTGVIQPAICIADPNRNGGGFDCMAKTQRFGEINVNPARFPPVYLPTWQTCDYNGWAYDHRHGTRQIGGHPRLLVKKYAGSDNWRKCY